MEVNRYKILCRIDSPTDVKKLNSDELRELCAEIRQYMIECCAVNPGHLGPSLGAVELMVGLHYVYDAPDDKLVFDVGHQAYAHKILTGRAEKFSSLRLDDGISGFPRSIEGVKISATIRKTETGCKMSVRAIPGFDAAAVCRKFGGGGHKGAAGASLSMSMEEAARAAAEALTEVVAG